MDRIILSVVGIGSLRDGPPVLAGLTGYFGERPMTVRVFDFDPELLDLFFLLARTFFLEAKSNHHLEAVETLAECLDGANIVVFCPSQNCLDKYGRELPNPAKARQRMVEEVLAGTGEECQYLSLRSEEPIAKGETLPNWPPDVAPELEPGLPHQILRWVHMDDAPFAYLEEHKKSPFSVWLEETCSFLRTS